MIVTGVTDQKFKRVFPCHRPSVYLLRSNVPLRFDLLSVSSKDVFGSSIIGTISILLFKEQWWHSASVSSSNIVVNS